MTTTDPASPPPLPPPPPAPSPHHGMGAVLHDAGVCFRVWAPNAAGVSVIGTFNEWNADADPLVHEAHGYWSADVPGARAGDRYRFAIRAQDGRVLERRDPYARDMEHSNGHSIVVDPSFQWPDDGFRMPPWDELVIYELHIGTFNDDPGGAAGTLQSVVNRLDYLVELGINCIELMPPAEFPTDLSLGYNPSHIFAVEDAYGGPDSLKNLVVEAHRRGIAVILDVVYNHLGPGDLDLWEFDGWSENGKGGIYFYNDWRSSTPWGDTRPDYRRGEVRQFIRDNALYWLEEFRLDGLRWDATGQIRNARGGDNPGDRLPEGEELIRWVNAEVNRRQPWKLLVAEDLQTNHDVTRPVAEGGMGFDTQWDAQFVHPVRETLIARHDEDRDVGRIAHAVAYRYGGSALHRVVYTESHDEVMNGRARLPHDVWPGHADSWVSRKRSTLGAALMFTAPGIPMIFQGQEILEDGWFVDTDPVDWDKLHRFAGIQHLYRDLIRLRRNWWDTTRGLRGEHVRVHHVNHGAKVVAYHRWQHGGPRDDVVAAGNFSHRPLEGYRVGFPRGGEWRVRFNSDWNGYSPDFGNHPSHHTRAEPVPWDGMPFSATVGLGPYTAILLSQE